MNYKNYKVPLPNIGKCKSTGMWSSPDMVDDCKKCISSNSNLKYTTHLKPGDASDDWQDKKFYCNGKCVSQYSLNESCAYDDLVAKTISHCEKPCKQQGPPSLSGGCSDSFDCKNGEKCVIRDLGKYHTQRGVCVSVATQFSINSDFVGVL